jgi:hypothetical protein
MNVTRTQGLSFTGKEMFLATPYRLRKRPPGGKPPGGKPYVQIFLHIPKCAGTTLDFIMACCASYQHTHYRRFVVSGYTPPVWIRTGWTGAWDSVVHSADSARSRLTHISGHFPFGVDAYFLRPTRYIALVRDPVAREVSSYNFHYQRGFLDEKRSLKSLVEDRSVLDNPQVRMLAGKHAMTGECTEATYRTALRNIETRFELVGTVDKSDEFLRALVAVNGWPAVIYPRSQVTELRLIERPDQDLERVLYDYHLFDARLHEFASRRWEEWKGPLVSGDVAIAPDDDVIVVPPDFQRARNYAVVKGRQITAAGVVTR